MKTTGWILGVFALLTSLAAPGWAQAKKESDKLELKKLEDKYWSAKDTDFSVVQNRTYTKQGRPFVNLSYGVLINDPNSTGRLTQVAAGYYFSERWGLEVSHVSGQISDNDSTEKYKQQFSVDPDYNRYKSYTSVGAVFVPFYAKMSFMDRSIMYFDMQFSAGVGSKSYEIYISPAQGSSETKSTLGYHFDFTQQLFFSEGWSVRLDLKNQWSRQDRKRSFLTSGQTESDRALPANTINDSMLMLGLTYFF